MLYWIAEHLGFTGLLNLIRYQSFRTGAAVATALFIGLIIGPRFIGWLRVRQGKGSRSVPTARRRTSPSGARRRWAD